MWATIWDLMADHLRNFSCLQTYWSPTISHHKLPLASHMDEFHQFMRVFHNLWGFFTTWMLCFDYICAIWLVSCHDVDVGKEKNWKWKSKSIEWFVYGLVQHNGWAHGFVQHRRVMCHWFCATQYGGRSIRLMVARANVIRSNAHFFAQAISAQIVRFE